MSQCVECFLSSPLLSIYLPISSYSPGWLTTLTSPKARTREEEGSANSSVILTLTPSGPTLTSLRIGRLAAQRASSSSRGGESPTSLRAPALAHQEPMPLTRLSPKLLEERAGPLEPQNHPHSDHPQNPGLGPRVPHHPGLDLGQSNPHDLDHCPKISQDPGPDPGPRNPQDLGHEVRNPKMRDQSPDQSPEALGRAAHGDPQDPLPNHPLRAPNLPMTVSKGEW